MNFAARFGSTVSRVGDAALNAGAFIDHKLDPTVVDEELWSLHGDVEELEERCKEAVKSSVILNADAADQSAPLSPVTSGLAVRDSTGAVLIKTPDGVVNKMPAAFFTAEFDPVIGLIEEVSKWPQEIAHEHFMNRIEECDTDKGMIVEKLSRLIQRNYPALMNQLVDLESIGADMRRALNQIAGSRALLQSGRETLTAGSMHIGTLKKQAENMQLVTHIGQSLLTVRSIKDAIADNLLTGEVGKAAECALHVLHNIRNSEYSQFRALSDMEAAVQNKFLLSDKRQIEL